MSAIDRISMALLKDAGIDPKRVRAVWYEHRVGQMPTLTAELVAARNNAGEFIINDDEVTTVTFEWRQQGTERTIVRGTPEWDEWIKDHSQGDEDGPQWGGAA